METWGKYRLDSLIARGGMAEVFRAGMQGPSGFFKPVCIKRIRPELGDDPEFVEMFEREARIAALLTHPNIVQVFDFDRHDDRLFIVMELVDGLDLRNIIRDVRELGLRVPVGFALYVIRGLLEALGHAHALVVEGSPRPVIHRDVSPHNILVSTDGAVKLTDFGIAKARGASAATRQGVVKGKLAYLSPEQARGEELEPASDLFGAGLVFHELLTGRRAFGDGGDHEVVARVLRAEIAPISEVSTDLREFLARLLAPSPRARFATAGEALAALERIDTRACGAAEAAALVRSLVSLRARPGSTGLHEGVTPTGDKPSRPPSVSPMARGSSSPPASAKRGGRMVLVGFAALIAIALVILGVYRRPDAVPPEGADLAPRPVGGPPAEVADPDPEEPPPVARPPSPGFEPVLTLAADPADEADIESFEDDEPRPERERARTTGLLDVHCRPWARVSMDGKPVGTTPITGMRVPAGARTLVLTNQELGYRKTLNVDVRPGRRTVVRETFTDN